MNQQVSTFFALMAEFGTAEIPLDEISEKYFGLSPDRARNKAARQQLPVPAYRGGSQKSQWLISAAELANHLDDQKHKARQQWANSQTNA